MARTVSDATPIEDLFAPILDEEPDLASLVQEGETLTYRDWWRESGIAASVLDERGVRPGDVVLLLLPSGRAFAVWYLAALRLGAIGSGLNPRLGPREIDHILARSQPRATVTDTPHRLPAGPGSPAGAVIDVAAVSMTGTPSVDGTVAVPADAPAVVVWTTGTTGLPKGAWFDHATLRYIAGSVGPLSAWHDRKLMPVPFAHAGYVTKLYDQLVSRSTLILTPPVWSAPSMLDTLVRERVTLGQGVPTQWEKLVQLDELEGADLSSLRLVATGAARVPATLVTALRERLGCPIVVRYAGTEMPVAFGTGVDDPPETVAHTVGRPLGGAEVEIRSPDGTVLPPGSVGRVHLRGRASMRGYWRDPERTAATRSPDGWIAFEDLGALDADGNLRIVGRADDAYIRGGYNVHPSEVEAALATHPAVARAAVVGAAAPVIGEVGVAFVVPHDPEFADADGLREHCRARIADYKVPDVVVFLPDLPVNATYKVDVPRLRELAAEAAATSRRPAADGHGG